PHKTSIDRFALGDPLAFARLRALSVLDRALTVNHPFACGVALEVQRTIEDDDLLDAVVVRGHQLRARLKERFENVEIVGDVRDRGLFVGVEFVDDRDSKAPYSGGATFAAWLKREALQHGLLIYPGAGAADGVEGNHVLFAPPFISSACEIDEMAECFEDIVRACMGER
ncbi:aminotransferase class III-fold pyridoxal phosphate-dependent enzyme, partial [Paraburkholderia atlantica]|uniref:aminotransferase class III-fold pyridoxal phosphate-dependent enzyme n=1 Tax=Paraburkholderia atlantica TaxID=2654982 RepID=UPI00161B5BDF